MAQGPPDKEYTEYMIPTPRAHNYLSLHNVLGCVGTLPSGTALPDCVLQPAEWKLLLQKGVARLLRRVRISSTIWHSLSGHSSFKRGRLVGARAMSTRAMHALLEKTKSTNEGTNPTRSISIIYYAVCITGNLALRGGYWHAFVSILWVSLLRHDVCFVSSFYWAWRCTCLALAMLSHYLITTSTLQSGCPLYYRYL